MNDFNLEMLVASMIFHYPNLLEDRLIESEDFFNNQIKADIQLMIDIQHSGGIIDENVVKLKYQVPSDDVLSNYSEYVISLKQLNGQRKLLNLPKRIVEIVDSRNDYADKLLKIDALISKFKITRNLSDEFLIENSIDSYMNDLMNPDESQIHVIKSGIYELDYSLAGGFKKGWSVVIAGETGNYKSTLMYNMALYNALTGKKVIIFAYEIGVEEIISIFLGMIVNVNPNSLTGLYVRDLPTAKIDGIKAASELLKTLPIHIVDITASLDDIKLMCLKYKPDVLFIDYIQLMPGVSEDNVESLERITRDIKLLAKKDKLNIPIISLSQFSRGIKGQSQSIEHKNLSDLKGASSIEQNADVVIFTEKSTILTSKNVESNKIKLMIKKNRHGFTGFAGDDKGIQINPICRTIGTTNIVTKSKEYKGVLSLT